MPIPNQLPQQQHCTVNESVDAGRRMGAFSRSALNVFTFMSSNIACAGKKIKKTSWSRCGRHWFATVIIKHLLNANCFKSEMMRPLGRSKPRLLTQLAANVSRHAEGCRFKSAAAVVPRQAPSVPQFSPKGIEALRNHVTKTYPTVTEHLVAVDVRAQ